MIKSYFFFLIFLLIAKGAQAEKICLVLSVQNDEDVIEDCLERVKQTIDFALICDFGSNDQTKEKIHTFCKTNSFPYKIIYPARLDLLNLDSPRESEAEEELFKRRDPTQSQQEEGTDRFVKAEKPNQNSQTLTTCSLSRNDKIAGAQNFLQNLNIDLYTTYLLFLNADAICEIGESFSKKDLKKDAYWVLEESDDFSHFSWNPNFFKAAIQWDIIEPYFEERLQNFSINKNSHESYQQTNATRKIKELLQTIKTDPYNQNLILKIASFHKYLKQYDQAIHYYEKCARKLGFTNQIWFAKYMLGECFEAINDGQNSLYWYLEAYHTQNKRVEPLRKLSKYHFIPISGAYDFKENHKLEINL